MRSMKWIPLGLLLLFGCLPNQADETAHLQVEIFTTDGKNSLLQADSPAQMMELVLVDVDKRQDVETTRVEISEQQIRLPEIPYQGNFRVYIRGFSELAGRTQIHFYGASQTFEAKEGENRSVPVQVGQINCMNVNAQSTHNSSEQIHAPNTNQGRMGASVTLLKDGRVLIVGGAEAYESGRPGRVLNSIEIYEPGSGHFFLRPETLNTPRAFHSATLLDTGEVLIVGGANQSNTGALSPNAHASILSFDEEDRITIQALGLPAEGTLARYHHQAIPLNDEFSSVLVLGGLGDNGAPLASALRYFPEDRIFEAQGDMGSPRVHFAGGSFELGRGAYQLAFASGGLGAGESLLDSMEVFVTGPAGQRCHGQGVPTARRGCFSYPGEDGNPAQSKHSSPRWHHQAVPIDRGRQVLFVGGYSDFDKLEGIVHLELLNEALQFISNENIGSLRAGRGELSATPLHDGSLLVVGGYNSENPTTFASRLIPFSTKGLTEGFQIHPLMDCELSEGRMSHTAIRLEHGPVLVLGGLSTYEGNPFASRRPEIYFPSVGNLKFYYGP